MPDGVVSRRDDVLGARSREDGARARVAKEEQAKRTTGIIACAKRGPSKDLTVQYCKCKLCKTGADELHRLACAFPYKGVLACGPRYCMPKMKAAILVARVPRSPDSDLGLGLGLGTAAAIITASGPLALAGHGCQWCQQCCSARTPRLARLRLKELYRRFASFVTGSSHLFCRRRKVRCSIILSHHTHRLQVQALLHSDTQPCCGAPHFTRGYRLDW